MTTEERIAIVETKLEERTDDITRILKEVRSDVKSVCKNQTILDKRVSSLEQTRKVTRIIGVPVIGVIISAVLKVFDLY